jgi:CRP-like cAMP-binding protein
MSVSVDELKEHRFFREWVKEELNSTTLTQLEILAQNCDIEFFEPKERLTFEKGSNRNKPCFYLIKEGSFIIYFPTSFAVKVVGFKSASGNRFLFALRSKVHETIGEVGLLAEPAPHMDTRCMLEKAETIAIPIEDFRNFLEKFPKMWQKLFKIQMRKLLSARSYSESLQVDSRSGGACVAASLLAIANELEEDENKNVIEIKLLWDDFLAYISERTSSHVKTKLDLLRNERAIEYIETSGQGKHQDILAIQILDKKKLNDIASKRIIPKQQKKRKKNKNI